MTNMRRRFVLAAALGVLSLAPGLARATPGTCTIVPSGLYVFARVPSAGDFTFLLASVDGLAVPVDVDAAGGTFTMMRGALPVATFDTGVAGLVDTQLAGADVHGPIDAAGNISLPGFTVTLIFGGTPLPIAPTLATGTQTRTLEGLEYPIQGGVLDFQTGMVTLVGTDIIPTAPIVNEPTITELHLTCVLAPIPSAASLPKAPTAKLKAKATVTGSDAGDTLSLKGKLTAGKVPFDFAGSDLFIQLAGADGKDVVVAVVKAGGLTAKGKRFSTGSGSPAVEVVTGGKAAPAAPGGTVTIVNAKKSAKLNGKLSGLDLSGLVAGPAKVTVTVGSNVAPADVKMKVAKKK